jgi:hypothetical protein
MVDDQMKMRGKKRDWKARSKARQQAQTARGKAGRGAKAGVKQEPL